MALTELERKPNTEQLAAEQDNTAKAETVPQGAEQPNPVVAIDDDFVRATASLAEPTAIAIQNITAVLNNSLQNVMTQIELNKYVQQIVKVSERLKMLENFKG